MPKSKPVKDARERQVKLDPTQSSKVKKSVKFPRAASPEPGPVSSKSQVRASEDATDDSQKSTSSSPSFKIVAGSYEKLLYGFEGFITVAEDGCSYHLKPVFIFPAHVSCIKAVAASPGGKWLATGSADEIVKVWDLRRRKELGGLMHHAGTSNLQTSWFSSS